MDKMCYDLRSDRLSVVWCVWALAEMSCFCRWQLAQKQEWDGEHRPCLVPAASARAGSHPCGVWTLPQRKRQKPIPLSTRSVRFSTLINVLSFPTPNRTSLISYCLFINDLSSTIMLELRPPDLLFLPTGLCWWWKASEKICRWHICWYH